MDRKVSRADELFMRSEVQVAIVLIHCLVSVDRYIVFESCDAFTVLLLSCFRCLETLILGQLNKIRSTINNIRVLEKATDSAHQRLSVLNLTKEVSSKWSRAHFSWLSRVTVATCQFQCRRVDRPWTPEL